MNFAKASSVLYPILGENVADIVLSYMKPKKRKVITDKRNMFEFFKNNNLRLSEIDHIYQNLKQKLSPNMECLQLLLDRKDCRCRWCVPCVKYEELVDICNIFGLITEEWKYKAGVDREIVKIIYNCNYNMPIELYREFIKDFEIEKQSKLVAN